MARFRCVLLGRDITEYSMKTAYEKGVIYNQENRLEHWNSGTVQFCKIPHPQLYIITMKKEEEHKAFPLS